MALLDGKLIYCESFSLVGATAGTSTTNVLNHGIGEDAFGSSQTPDISNDGEMYLNVTCEDTDFASAGSPVVTISLRTADNASMSSASTLASFTTDKTPNDGDVIKSMVVPSGEVKQYTDLYVSSTATLTAGAITGFLNTTPLFDKRLSS